MAVNEHWAKWCKQKQPLDAESVELKHLYVYNGSRYKCLFIKNDAFEEATVWTDNEWKRGKIELIDLVLI